MNTQIKTPPKTEERSSIWLWLLLGFSIIFLAVAFPFTISSLTKDHQRAVDAWNEAWAVYADTAENNEQTRVVAYLKQACDSKFFVDVPEKQAGYMRQCAGLEIEKLYVQSMSRDELTRNIPKLP